MLAAVLLCMGLNAPLVRGNLSKSESQDDLVLCSIPSSVSLNQCHYHQTIQFHCSSKAPELDIYACSYSKLEIMQFSISFFIEKKPKC